MLPWPSVPQDLGLTWSQTPSGPAESHTPQPARRRATAGPGVRAVQHSPRVQRPGPEPSDLGPRKGRPGCWGPTRGL